MGCLRLGSSRLVVCRSHELIQEQVWKIRMLSILELFSEVVTSHVCSRPRSRYSNIRTLVEMDWLFLLYGLLIRQCLSCLTTSVQLSLAQCHAQAALDLHRPRPVGVLIFDQGSIYPVGSHWSPYWRYWALDLRQWQRAQMSSRFCDYPRGRKESICWSGSPL